MEHPSARPFGVSLEHATTAATTHKSQKTFMLATLDTGQSRGNEKKG